MAPGALVHVRGVRLAVMHVSLWLMTKTFREDVNKVLEDRFSELQRLFVFSCSKATGGQRDRSSGRLLDLAGWDRLLRKCNMFSPAFVQLQSVMVFTQSVMRVDNDVRDRTRATCLSFPDFVEALVRVRAVAAMWIAWPSPVCIQMAFVASMPTQEDMSSYKVTNAFDYFEHPESAAGTVCLRECASSPAA